MVKVKVCGITNMADALAAVQAGADLLGFIFYPASQRYVTPPQVRAIVTAVRQERPETVAVGVFVNETAATVARVLDDCGLDAAQLHGDEPPYLLGLEPGRSSPLSGRAYRAVRPRTLDEAVQQGQAFALPSTLRDERLPALLMDTYHTSRMGGTGQVADWSVAAYLAAHYPLLLAGGLTPHNVAAAVQAVRPWGVDVASGVERSPGQKDHAALRAFVAAARTAANEPAPPRPAVSGWII